MSPLAKAALETARNRQPEARGRRAAWSDDEAQNLAKLYPATPMHEIVAALGRSESSIYGKAALMGLKRSEAFLAGPASGRIRPGSMQGAPNRFERGRATWNKGMKGWQAEGCQETQFKPGQNPHNWNPVGHERLTKDGYLQRKMTDTKCTSKDYRMVHHLVWEEQNGPVPTGHALIFKDRNKTNIQLDNLELITRAELCRRNSIHRYPPELKELIRLQKKLERNIRKKADEKPDD